MKIIQLLFTLAPVALASPVSRSEGSQDVHIVLELSKLSAVTAVLHSNTELAYTPSPYDMKSLYDDSRYMMRQNLAGFLLLAGQPPSLSAGMTAKKSIYDRWLMTRFTIAFVILTVFEVTIVLFSMNAESKLAADLIGDAPDLSAERATTDFLLFMSGVTAAQLLFLVFGITLLFLNTEVPDKKPDVWVYKGTPPAAIMEERSLPISKFSSTGGEEVAVTRRLGLGLSRERL
ncbi:hypothetical protein B0T11DRAFT_321634 [Plectosphaerella cucumerina]|uniref:Uncharacterized protein n=1 Tax=Plectosphaerella cucumerina TaxID=40658 RepID=A0A8K0X0P2_9PEZI|nr:hypothetical protein B0T11DRAFT_321634 [Plectosphaerella cucumerina]